MWSFYSTHTQSSMYIYGIYDSHTYTKFSFNSQISNIYVHWHAWFILCACQLSQENFLQTPANLKIWCELMHTVFLKYDNTVTLEQCSYIGVHVTPMYNSTMTSNSATPTPLFLQYIYVRSVHGICTHTYTYFSWFFIFGCWF